jgi:RNA polymerase sigma-70 factor (ECF subfamily)
MNTKSLTFNEIYRKQFDAIYNYINSKTNKSISNFDLTQTVFERFYFNMNKYEFETLKDTAKILFTITNNIIIDTYRKKGNKPLNLDELTEKGIQIPDNKKEADMDVFSTFYKVINSMPENTQKILSMFFIEQYTLNDIAEILSIPLGTIKSHIKRNRPILQKALQNLK